MGDLQSGNGQSTSVTSGRQFVGVICSLEMGSPPVLQAGGSLYGVICSLEIGSPPVLRAGGSLFG